MQSEDEKKERTQRRMEELAKSLEGKPQAEKERILKVIGDTLKIPVEELERMTSAQISIRLTRHFRK